MKKPSTNPTTSPGRPVEVGHLEQTLTDFASSAGVWLKRMRLPLLGLVGCALLGLILYAIVLWLLERQSSDINLRLFELVQSPAAQSEGFEPEMGAIDQLLMDAQGHRAEKAIVRAVADFYLRRADRAAGRGQEDFPFLGARAADPKDQRDEKAIRENLEQALKVAEEALRRFPEAADMQTWAQTVKARVDEEEKQEWLKSRWKFLPLLPPSTPPAEPKEQPGGPGQN